MNDYKVILVLIVGVLAMAVIGCRSMLDKVTPCEISEMSQEYAEADPNESIWPTLATAKQLRTKIIIIHRDNQTDLLRLARDDKTSYKDAIGFIDVSIAESQVIQEMVVGGPDQPFSILGILAGAGIAFPIGKILKRKGDYSPEEFQVAVAKEKINESV